MKVPNAYSFAPMDLDAATEIASRWKYQPPYDFYDATADPDDYAEFVNPSKWPKCFFQVLHEGALVGFYTVAGGGDVVELSLGMHPDFVGRGFGTIFVQACLDHARELCHVSGVVTLHVATFNHRAIRVYERVGFKAVRHYVQRTNGGEFGFVEMRLHADRLGE